MQTESFSVNKDLNQEYDHSMFDPKEVLELLDSDQEADEIEILNTQNQAFSDIAEEDEDFKLNPEDLLPKDAAQKYFSNIVHHGASIDNKYPKEKNGITQYPCSSSKVKRSTYMKMLDSNFATVINFLRYFRTQI